MKAILTGASGGIGLPVARALSGEGVDVLLVVAPGMEWRGSAVHGTPPLVIEADLRHAEGCALAVQRAMTEWGRVDLLVNAAGVEYSWPFHELSSERIREVLAVNLHAPLELARLVLPGMLERRRGHIVGISSLAGKSAPAFQEPYAATKAALTAFTFSLRASYRGTGVSASVVCPGFVEAGIYTRLKAKTGSQAHWLLAGCPPEKVARAVIRAVYRDVPEILVNRYPLGIALALAAYSPRFGAWLTRQLGVNEFFRKAFEAEKRLRP